MADGRLKDGEGGGTTAGFSAGGLAADSILAAWESGTRGVKLNFRPWERFRTEESAIFTVAGGCRTATGAGGDADAILTGA